VSRRVHVRILVAASVSLALVGASACGEARDPFTRGMSFGTIEQAFQQQGLHLCSNKPSDTLPNQAVAGREYRVALDCSTSDDAAVTIDRFKQAEDRDAAARNFEVQARPRAGGAVYTVGPFAVLILPATSDDNITSRLNIGLKKLSAN